MPTVETEVLKIIAAKAQVEPATLAPGAKLSSLNISSLDVVEIVFALEEMFDIQIPFNANKAKSEFDTVGDVMRAVAALVAART
jgi:acyl carrier protein